MSDLTLRDVQQLRADLVFRRRDPDLFDHFYRPLPRRDVTYLVTTVQVILTESPRPCRFYNDIVIDWPTSYLAN